MANKTTPKPRRKAARKTTTLARTQTQALARPVEAGPQTIVEKLIDLSRDKSVSVEKINALIDANERVMKIAAKQQFDAAFAAMQDELPIIRKDALVTVQKDGRIIRETPFSSLQEIQRICRPIMARHGFGLRFRNAMKDNLLVVTGILTHRAGHSETDEFGPIARDDTGAKNVIQSWGSARRYGQRYVTISLLNLASDDPEDDGALVGEVLPDSETRTVPPPHRGPASTDDRPISKGTKKKPGQVERLWVIIRNSGRNEELIREWLLSRYGYTSTREIKRKHYDEICRAIEASGSLLSTAAREPGQEG